MIDRVNKPWGYYENLSRGGRYLVKKLVILPGHQFSLQTHEHRSEFWLIVSGSGTVTRDEDACECRPGGMYLIDREMRHRATNTSKTENLEIIEIQRGDTLSEEDVIRLDDDYGRKQV